MITICMPVLGNEEMSARSIQAILQHTHEPFHLVVSSGHKCIAQGWNAGVRHAIDTKSDLVLIGNDDVVKEHWLDAFRDKLTYNVGLVGCVRQGTKLGCPYVGFHVVYIPLYTLTTVGLFDERFEPYYWEDNDYCKSVVDYGLDLACVEKPKIDIGHSVTTTADPEHLHWLKVNAERFAEKWGIKLDDYRR